MPVFRRQAFLGVLHSLMLKLSHPEAYEVFARKDRSYDGVLFVGVTSTGIFCRPACPARLPRPENCQFYADAHAALKAGFRACKRCHPQRQPGEATPIVKQLIAAVEDAPDRRWRESDLLALSLDPSTVRRQFKARFGMTFAQYARARRLALAAKTLAQGDTVINAQIDAGYSSASGFRKAFGDAFGTPPKHSGQAPLLAAWIDTPLRPMMAIADDAALYLLEFTDRKNLERQVRRVSEKNNRQILPGRTAIHGQIETELRDYFAGKLTRFKTPLTLTGTDFQKKIWAGLCDIPYGETCSYLELAGATGNVKAVRAAASSNANNGLAIIVPCHRVISTGGGLGGYAGGLDRKRWLLDFEAGVRG